MDGMPVELDMAAAQNDDDDDGGGGDNDDDDVYWFHYSLWGQHPSEEMKRKIYFYTKNCNMVLMVEKFQFD